MDAFRFEAPEMLWLLLLLPLWMLWRGRQGRPAAVRFSSLGLIQGLAKGRRSRAGGLLLFGRVLALALLIGALARPQFGTSQSQIEASGVDIVLAIDISGSMWAHDFVIDGREVDRLTAVKRVVREFIDERPNDRIALVAFSGVPYLVSPLTLNHAWLLENLERLRIGMVEDGTAIGSALTLCTNRLRDLDAESRIVVLLTDGANTSGKIEPVAAAEAAAAFGVRVYAIGAGREGVVKVPRLMSNAQPMRDSRGNMIFGRRISDLDEETLKEIAAASNGRFFRATDLESLQAIYRLIDELETTDVEMDITIDYRDVFAWLAWPALGLLSLEQLLRHTRWRRLP